MPNKPKNADKNPARDEFQTPDYATKLLFPYMGQFYLDMVWECASGAGKMASCLKREGGSVFSSTLGIGAVGALHFDFLSANTPFSDVDFVIITNPPFSKKKKFYERCREYGVPFALLIPFDMCQWIHKAIWTDGCQAIVPSSRINYITPSGRSGKDSTAQFHSFWLTWGFGLEERFVGVELTDEMKLDI